MNPNELTNKLNRLIIKNQLLTIPSEELCKIYNDKELMTILIYMLNDLIKNEPEFIIVCDEIVDNIQNILFEKRQQYKKDELNLSINNIIIKLNSIIGEEKIYKEEKKKNYKLNQLYTRNLNYNLSFDELKNLIIYDAITYNSLINPIKQEITIEYFISSLNYLMEYVPELFENGLILLNTNCIIKDLEQSLKFIENVKRKDKIIIQKQIKDINKKIFKSDNEKQIIKTKRE